MHIDHATRNTKMKQFVNTYKNVIYFNTQVYNADVNDNKYVIKVFI